MRFVVTGGLGHIGSRLIRTLPQRFPGAEVVIIDSLATQRYPSLFNLPGEGRYRFVEADATTCELEPLLAGADAVINLAAITDAAGSFGNREKVERENYGITERVALACVKVGAPLITASSTSVYGTQKSRVDEDCDASDLAPQSPYAETKLREEALVMRLAAEQGLKATIFRFGTIFGVSPGMRFHTAVNKFCWQAVLGQKVTVWRTAYDQMRPYLDLGDAVEAVAFTIERRMFDARVYNVVTSNHTVRDVVDAIRAHVPDLDVTFVDEKIMNQLSYEVDNTRMLAAGFTFKGDLKTALAETIALLRNMNNGAK
ncbi:nucleoside-diphosphate sugar epimerase [Paramagnetospirillum marisnigri]|uniref:Nucleoside-diphosphate sugar epimerase n=1 Tax=Paramagnetospirillum marisnigri TaxID=1285242 RepID=A0A178MY98_9PROT|nr:SDR family oxidoreductase [Paramagnetospirillum marisnigri]OAN54653.1 nucleoside-diphosphate sugar epimerase [Paramagnetospirillum marisnigri]